jgi:hypothetical protein
MFVRKVADARRKSEAQQMTRTEDVVGEAGRAGVVLLNPEIRLVIEQTIKNVRCVSHRGVDDHGMKGCVKFTASSVALHSMLGGSYVCCKPESTAGTRR